MRIKLHIKLVMGIVLPLVLLNFTSCNDDDSCQETTFYLDADGDGFGSETQTKLACAAPEGYVDNGTDLDDTNEMVFPGCTEKTYYQDGDGDGFGNSQVSVTSCVAPEGYVDVGEDLDDTDSDIFPDCDLSTYYEDADSDGYGNADVSLESCVVPEGYVADNTDLDDTNENIFPGCTQTAYYEDADDDGYGNAEVLVMACVQPEGYVADNTDCDDNDAGINPGAIDDPYDGIDSNCDGTLEQVVTIWTGEELTFSQIREQNWQVEVNQDRLTEKVVFTRNNLGGPMYNFQWWIDNLGRDGSKVEIISDFWNNGELEGESGGTKGVRWAILDDTGAQTNDSWAGFKLYGTLGDPTNFYSFHNIGTMLYLLEDSNEIPISVIDDFNISSDDGEQDSTCMPCLEGKKLGLWLVEEDIYLTLTFTHWGVGPTGSGEFTYTRSTPNN